MLDAVSGLPDASGSAAAAPHPAPGFGSAAGLDDSPTNNPLEVRPLQTIDMAGNTG